MSVGLAKACVPGKIASVSEKIEFPIEKLNRMRSLHSFMRYNMIFGHVMLLASASHNTTGILNGR